MSWTNYENLCETVYRKTLPNGLQVAVVPRRGFTKKQAYLVADFGAIDTQFTCDGELCQLPHGTAHYLEHKLFDMPDMDVSARFAELGAAVNAFTSYDMTAYYFFCTEHFAECLALLVKFVTTPYFTEQSVQKEQGIIGQEIGMNEDNPDTRIFENLMQAMYENHNIRNPILGTKESIAQITPQVLETAHQAFYRPENLLLCVVGDVDPNEVCKIAMDNIAPFAPVKVQRLAMPQEQMYCVQPLCQCQMDVSMPTFQLGFKCENPGTGEQAVVREMVGDLAAEALFGESSRLYMELYEEGLIDSSFGGGFETVKGMAMLTASGDSPDAQQVKERILLEARRIVQEGLAESDFLRMKRSALGRRMRDLDSFDSLCFRICAYHFADFDYFCFPQVYAQVTKEEICAFIGQTVTPDRCSLSLIYPNTQEE